VADVDGECVRLGRRQLRWLNAIRPPMLFGYPTILARLAVEQRAGRLGIAPGDETGHDFAYPGMADPGECRGVDQVAAGPPPTRR
jgi:hypothetical protein